MMLAPQKITMTKRKRNQKGVDLIDKDVRLNTVDLEVRQLGEEKDPVIRGYALKFDEPSEDLGFTEYLDKRCLDNANMDNVVALLNHDTNYVLGRTGRNLKLQADDVGLFFEIEPNNTTYVRDLIENMKTGLIDKCSFAFTIPKGGDEWREKDGRYERYIRQIDRLYDVSIVTTPAYNGTEALVSERSKESLKNLENRDRELEIMEMEMDL